MAELLEPAGATATTVTVEHRVIGTVDEVDRAGYATGWEEIMASLARCVRD